MPLISIHVGIPTQQLKHYPVDGITYGKTKESYLNININSNYEKEESKK